MLTLHSVRKRYGTTVAVDGLSLAVRPGEIVGLLGPNGAGKSTAVGLSVGLLAPDSGTVTIGDGGDPRDPEVRRAIGVAPQALALYDTLTARENLRFFGQMHGLSGARLSDRVDQGLDAVRLSERADDRVARYSGGMKRRLNLTAALLHEPSVILLDEPTAGVDPQSRNQIFDTILSLRREGRAVVYSTHYMEEAERLCDRIAIIDHGQLLAFGTLAELLATHGAAPRLVVTTRDGEQRIETVDPLTTLNRIAATMPIDRFHVERPTLEQVFLQRTGRSLRDQP